jgi:hypothetical protein
LQENGQERRCTQNFNEQAMPPIHSYPMTILQGFAWFLIFQCVGEAVAIDGISAFAALIAAVTGMIGALSAKDLFDQLRIDSPALRGLVLGTASHGIGAARAMQVRVYP